MLRAAFGQLRNKCDLIGAEIGVFRGGYSFVYLKELDIKKIFLIDPYMRYENYDRYSSEALKTAEEIAHSVLSVHEDKIKWIKTKSVDAASLFDDESLDFVYIDGNHEYQFVLQDITLYYPKVKKGGLMSGHDYRSYAEDKVFDAVNEFCKKNHLQLHIISKPLAQNSYIDNYDWWIWK